MNMSLLNTPIMVGNVEMKNRIVMPPMATAKSDENGKVTDRLCDYYNEKSSGGYLGLIITEHSYVNLQGKASKGQLSIAEDSDIDGMKRIASTIHNNHTNVFAQINHAGSKSKQVITGFEPLSASSIKLPFAKENDCIPKEMTQIEIQNVVNDLATAALRVKKAGFDGVEIHSAHGYLLNQFFSPLTNERKDKYSGEILDGRIKLHLEIIEAVRKAVGSSYPVSLRLGACDFIEGGIVLEDSIYACKEFEKAGIDLLNISGGFYSYINLLDKEQGYFSNLSEKIKEAVHIPVILTGGITEATIAERLLQEHKADLIGIGRAMLKDSQWAKKQLKIYHRFPFIILITLNIQKERNSVLSLSIYLFLLCDRQSLICHIYRI